MINLPFSRSFEAEESSLSQLGLAAELETCEEKRQLTEAIRATMTRIMELMAREIEATTMRIVNLSTGEATTLMAEHEAAAERLNKELNQMMAAKRRLLKKYKDHVREHGC